MISEPVKRFAVTQGNFKVSQDPDIVLTTVLGSCVCACVYDPDIRIGGMNHFLLPNSSGSGNGSSVKLFGAYLMELLLNGMFERGAIKSRLEVKLFGGSHLLSSISDPGKKNVDFIQQFVKAEMLNVVSSSLRGDRGRNIEFDPYTGKARQRFMCKDLQEDLVVKQPERQELSGELELF